jgi:hypothetical protein
MTYTLIDSEVLASAAASVTFTSIPADYRDLILVWDYLGSGGIASAQIQFNGDTASNYNLVRMTGNGSTTASAALSARTAIFLSIFDATTTERSLGLIQVMDYSATDKNKTVLCRANVASAGVQATAGRWANNSAVSSLTVSTGSNSYAAGSTFYLYGIEA